MPLLPPADELYLEEGKWYSFPQGAGMKEVVKERNLVYTGAAYYETLPGTLTHRRSQFFNFGVRKYRSHPHDFLLTWTRNMPSEVSYFQFFSWFMFPFCCQPSSQTSKRFPYHSYLKAFSSSLSCTSPSAGHGTQELPVERVSAFATCRLVQLNV